MTKSRVHRPLGGYVTATIIGYIAMIVTGVAGLIVIPLGIRYFGAATYGIWLVIQSLANYVRGADLGMPNALLTLFARAGSRADRKALLSRSVIIASMSGALLATALLLTLRLAPRAAQAILGGTVLATSDVLLATTVVLVGIALTQPFSVAAAAVSGLHDMASIRLLQIPRALLSVGALWLVTVTHGGLVQLAGLTVGTEVLLGSLVMVRLAQLLSGGDSASGITQAPQTKALLPLGLSFFVLQALVLIINNTDNLIVVGALGAASVAQFAVPYKLLQAMSGLVGALQGPLWPGYAAAIARGDWAWVTRVYGISEALVLSLGGLVWVVAIPTVPIITRIWLGPSLQASQVLVFVMGAYFFLFGYSSMNAIFLNACGKLRTQMMSLTAEAIINIGLSIILVRSLGIIGTAIGTLAGCMCVSIWLLPRDAVKHSKGALRNNVARAPAFLVAVGLAAVLSLLGATVNDSAVRALAFTTSALTLAGAIAFFARSGLLAARSILMRRALV